MMHRREEEMAPFIQVLRRRRRARVVDWILFGIGVGVIIGLAMLRHAG
jgi:hypothetical protein